MALLLLHGSADSPRCWSGVVAALDGVDVATPPLPGPPLEGAALAGDLEWLEAIVAGLGVVDLVGHSYGALLALRFALAHPGAVRRLGMCEPIAFHLLAGRPEMSAIDGLNAQFFGELEQGRPRRGLAGLVDYWNGPGAFDALPEGAQGRLVAGLERTAAEVASGMQDRTTAMELAALTMPCMVLAGEQTTAASLGVCARIAGATGAPYVVVRGAGHQAPRTHPDAVAGAIAALLRR